MEMLNLTQEQVNQFEDWKHSFLTQIDVMRETIRMSAPLYFETNKFYKKLQKIANIIDSLEVEETRACYTSAGKGKEITDEREFGFYLCTYLEKIDREVPKEANKIFHDAFADKEDDLKRIFKI